MPRTDTNISLDPVKFSCTRMAGSHHTIPLLALLALCITTVDAQPSLNFTRVNLQWPVAELYFSARQNGVPMSGLLREQFRVVENGCEVPDFVLHPPKPIPCPMSVAIVLDASGSMMGANNAGLKAGATAFVDRMDGNHDQAALVKFATNPSLMLAMTTDTAALKDTIQTLPASGHTTAWDGIWMGLDELILHGQNDCKAVIIITDSGDGSSTHWSGDIIPKANRERIRVYTIGLGSGINVVELEMIAIQTGGRFFHATNPTMLPAIYDSIATIIKDEAFGDRVITYESRCPDGTLRTVELGMLDAEGNWRSGTKTLRAPRDTVQPQPFPVQLVGSSVQGGSPVMVQVVAVEAIDEALPVRLKAVFQTKMAGLRFDSAWAPAGSSLAGQPLSITRYPDSTVVRMTGTARLSGRGTLLLARYSSETVLDTTCGSLELLAIDAGTGCLRAASGSAQYCLYPSGPSILVIPESTPEFIWNAQLGTYQPSSAEVRFRVENIGSTPAEAPMYRLSGYSPHLNLLAPGADTQPGAGPRLAPGSSETVTWRVEPRRTRTTDTIRIGLKCNFNNAASAFAEGRVILHSSLPDLRCELSIPGAVIDSKGHAFEPFPVMVTVYNHGGDASDSVAVELELSADLALHPASPGRLVRVPLVPPLLPPGGQGSASWLLTLPVVPTGALSAVAVAIHHGVDDIPKCVATLAIPPLDTMRTLGISISGRTVLCPGESATLIADSGYTSYRWSCGDTIRSIRVTAGGKYSVDAVDAQGARRHSEAMFIRESTLPALSVHISSFPACEGDTVQLFVEGTFQSYQWNTGETTRIINVSRAGHYELSVITADGCFAMASTNVTFLPIPARPEIYRSYDTLFTDVVAGSYRWFRDYQQVYPEKRYYVARIAGVYTVEASNGGKCKSTSAPFKVSVLGVSETSAPSVPTMRLYPDPAADQLTIEIDGNPGSSMRLTLVDFLGRSRVIAAEEMSKSTYSLIVPVAQLPAGHYLLVLHCSGRQIVKRFRKL